MDDGNCLLSLQWMIVELCVMGVGGEFEGFKLLFYHNPLEEKFQPFGVFYYYL